MFLLHCKIPYNIRSDVNKMLISTGYIHNLYVMSNVVTFHSLPGLHSKIMQLTLILEVSIVTFHHCLLIVICCEMTLGSKLKFNGLRRKELFMS